MDSHVWRTVYQTIKQANREIPRQGRRPVYSDVLIVAMYLWSVWHDRPLCWACDRSHYGGCFRPRRLPSVSQFCKRLRTEHCDALLQRIHEISSRMDWPMELSFLDGRAMRVGAYSKDRDATRGSAPGGMAKGYKLHVWASQDGRIPVWGVTGLNVNEKTVARELLRYRTAEELVLADAAYDSGGLYDQVANDGGHFLTPLPTNAGGGHRRQSPSRLAAARAWKDVAGYVYRERLGVERILAHSSTFGGGLGPLPSWVRSLPRVRRWIGAKLILYHARWAVRKEAI